MLSEKFYEVLTKEGVVSIVSNADNEAHVSNTWNSYINISNTGKILIPAAGMIKTQANIKKNNKIKMTLGSKEVEGYRSMGTGFLIEGKAEFVTSGDDFDMMKEKFPFLSRVLEIEVTSFKQTL